MYIFLAVFPYIHTDTSHLALGEGFVSATTAKRPITGGRSK